MEIACPGGSCDKRVAQPSCTGETELEGWTDTTTTVTFTDTGCSWTVDHVNYSSQSVPLPPGRPELTHPVIGPDGEQIDWPVMALRRGPDHCFWDRVGFLLMGWPVDFGTPDPEEIRAYCRDPGNFLPEPRLTQSLDVDATLPPDANFTAYRTTEVEVWLSPSDWDDAAYLVFNNRVERWPRGQMWICD